MSPGEVAEFEAVAEYADAVQLQPLLIPVTFHADAVEVGTVEENQIVLSVLGFDIAVLSPTTLALRAIPALLKNSDAQSLARDVLRDVREFGGSYLRIVGAFYGLTLTDLASGTFLPYFTAGATIGASKAPGRSSAARKRR